MNSVIAVDGPAASGKGTIARKIAAIYDFSYLDTGKLYRAVGLAVLRAGDNPEDSMAAKTHAITLTTSENRDNILALLEDATLGSDDAAKAASKVAALPEVRSALRDFQRSFAHAPPHGQGAVLDGRDIGTVICPTATVKLFVTANVEIRANRRHQELLLRGEKSTYMRVLQDLTERDARDSNRADSPLKPAADAFMLDTTTLNIEEAVKAAINFTKRHFPNIK